MNKKIKTVICITMIVCTIMSINVSASANSEITMSVTYTEVDTSKQETYYEVSIPAEISLNETCLLPIEMTYSELSDNQALTVYIDGDRSFPENDGYMHLHLQDSTDEKLVVVQKYYSSTKAAEVISRRGQHELCVFNRENGYTTDVILMLDAIYKGTIDPGTYSGNIYFTFELSNN